MKIHSDREIRDFFEFIKRNLNESIKNEDKKELNFLLCETLWFDLIRHGNLIHNRKKSLRPNSPHLPIFKPQQPSTFSISHRIPVPSHYRFVFLSSLSSNRFDLLHL
jgi:hypothetical protein